VDSNLVEQIWSLVEKDAETGCWLWKGRLTSGAGRPLISYGHHRTYHVARVLYEVAHPEAVGNSAKLFQSKVCTNKLCVCPDHHELRTSFKTKIYHTPDDLRQSANANRRRWAAKKRLERQLEREKIEKSKPEKPKVPKVPKVAKKPPPKEVVKMTVGSPYRSRGIFRLSELLKRKFVFTHQGGGFYRVFPKDLESEWTEDV